MGTILGVPMRVPDKATWPAGRFLAQAFVSFVGEANPDGMICHYQIGYSTVLGTEWNWVSNPNATIDADPNNPGITNGVWGSFPIQSTIIEGNTVDNYVRMNGWIDFSDGSQATFDQQMKVTFYGPEYIFACIPWPSPG
jgi:hypothetical protein